MWLRRKWTSYYTEWLDWQNIKLRISNVKARRKALSSDGRCWFKDSTSWAEYGHMRFANCCDTLVCSNSKCMYQSQYGIVNKMQFSKGKCTACEVTAASVACCARCYIFVKRQKLRVFHCGDHTCPVYTKSERPVANERDVLKKGPTLKPSQVQSALLFSLLWEGELWDKIDKEASKLKNGYSDVHLQLDPPCKWISNQKQAVRTQSPGRKL
ncbi:Hypothetical predicted protein [Paramuricea clavata]|uniref:Uncharacterized protein n=1 Tax=Paramuricea clavata TaxID=317549 RepID=A0A6S7JT72_PARCT|nr:Hypothetical predicted protein [Paramuricea clavata]